MLVDEERNTFSLGTAIADLRDRVSRDFIPPFAGDKVRSGGSSNIVQQMARSDALQQQQEFRCR